MLRRCHYAVLRSHYAAKSSVLGSFLHMLSSFAVLGSFWLCSSCVKFRAVLVAHATWLRSRFGFMRVSRMPARIGLTQLLCLP